MNQDNQYTKRFATCSKDCYGGCVFNGYWDDKVEEKKFLYGEPLKSHPFTNGFFCSKLNNRENLIYHSNRLKTALLRSNSKGVNSFKPITIKEAISLISNKLKENIKTNPKSVLGAFYSGNTGLLSMYGPLRFFNLINGTITKGGICNEAGCQGLKDLFGTYSTTNPFQIINENTNLVVVWGSNLADNNIHMYRLIKKALKKGIHLVVVDVRKTSLAKEVDIFLEINPGMDHILVKLILKEIFKRGKEDKKFLHKYVKLEEPIPNLIDDLRTDQVLSEIGIPKTDFRKFVDLLVKYKHQTIFDIGYGPQKRLQGGKIIRTIALIQIVLGNLCKPGTGIIYSQSDFTMALKNELIQYLKGSLEDSQANTIELIDLASELKSQNYKVLFIYNFNPVSSLPNQNLLKSVLQQPGLFTVVVDMFLNETTKYADIVIPAKFSIEQNDIFFPYYIPSLSITEGGGCPYSQCVSNYEFFQSLAQDLELNKSDQFIHSQKDLFFSCLKLLPDHIRKDLKKQGYHLLFKEDEVPYKDLYFPTSDQKIHVPLNTFNFKTFEQKRLDKLGARELFLISPSHKRFLHSQLGPIQGEHSRDFNKIFLSSMDIVNFKINIGDLVEVFNERGSAKYEVDEMRSLKKGVALIYKGQPSKINEKKPSVNIFTPSQKENLGHSGSYFSTIVKISK